ncbi:hypothetical protein LPJ67_006535, partial [Coemansia sp. RSA 1938]
LGRCTTILSIDIEQKNGAIRVSQESAIMHTLETHGMSDCNLAKTPLPHSTKLVKAQDGDELVDMRDYQSI